MVNIYSNTVTRVHKPLNSNIKVKEKILKITMWLLFSLQVVSESLQPHGLLQAMLPCPSLSPGFAQIHVHWVSDAMQPSHPLSPPSPPALNLPESGSFPESDLHIRCPKYWSFSISLPRNIQGWFPLGLTSLIFQLSKGLSRVFSSTTVWKHQFLNAQPSLWSNSHICRGLLKKP